MLWNSSVHQSVCMRWMPSSRVSSVPRTSKGEGSKQFRDPIITENMTFHTKNFVIALFSNSSKGGDTLSPTLDLHLRTELYTAHHTAQY